MQPTVTCRCTCYINTEFPRVFFWRPCAVIWWRRRLGWWLKVRPHSLHAKLVVVSLTVPHLLSLPMPSLDPASAHTGVIFRARTLFAGWSRVDICCEDVACSGDGNCGIAAGVFHGDCRAEYDPYRKQCTHCYAPLNLRKTNRSNKEIHKHNNIWT